MSALQRGVVATATVALQRQYRVQGYQGGPVYAQKQGRVEAFLKGRNTQVAEVLTGAGVQGAIVDRSFGPPDTRRHGHQPRAMRHKQAGRNGSGGHGKIDDEGITT